MCKEEAASPSQQMVQRQHQGVEAGKQEQAGGAGMWCVGGGRIGGGEGGGGIGTCDDVTRGVMRRSVGV